MSDQQLRQFFQFDETDLQANRNGLLSERQKSHLMGDEKLGKVLVLIIAVGILAAAAWPLIGAIRGGTTRTPGNWGLDAVVLLAGLGIDAWLVRRLTIKKDYQLGKVQGRASIITTSGGHTTYYELHLGGQKFEVDEGIADVINQGDAYIIYYVKDYNDIVAAEEAPAGK